ncbi:MAG TPA: hypothetical protein VE379_02430 [Vicinamibacterales bacterium]|jgi:hypothetical protein|nr:hypothetical protein [Vicinamibacterales bacterium]
MDAARFLVQILLPLYDNEGRTLDAELFGRVRAELTERFGGLTAHMRAPARGLWKTEDGGVARDDIVILEVMAEALDGPWWDAYRRTLEARFRQEQILVRATRVELL